MTDQELLRVVVDEKWTVVQPASDMAYLERYGDQISADNCHLALAYKVEELTAQLASKEAENKRLREALEDIAKQKKTLEIETEYEEACADFEEGYDTIIDVARAALKGGK